MAEFVIFLPVVLVMLAMIMKFNHEEHLQRELVVALRNEMTGFESGAYQREKIEGARFGDQFSSQGLARDRERLKTRALSFGSIPEEILFFHWDKNVVNAIRVLELMGVAHDQDACCAGLFGEMDEALSVVAIRLPAGDPRMGTLGEVMAALPGANASSRAVAHGYLPESSFAHPRSNGAAARLALTLGYGISRAAELGVNWGGEAQADKLDQSSSFQNRCMTRLTDGKGCLTSLNHEAEAAAVGVSFYGQAMQVATAMVAAQLMLHEPAQQLATALEERIVTQRALPGVAADVTSLNFNKIGKRLQHEMVRLAAQASHEVSGLERAGFDACRKALAAAATGALSPSASCREEVERYNDGREWDAVYGQLSSHYEIDLKPLALLLRGEKR
jgi:hypothetical protein